MSEAFPRIRGYCPMGCGETLFIGDGGWITCSLLGCPNPTAACDILEDRETEHVVTFGENGFTIRHPLRERLGEELMTCALHDYCEALSGPPVQLGRYRAVRDGDDGWIWRAMPPAEPEEER